MCVSECQCVCPVHSGKTAVDMGTVWDGRSDGSSDRIGQVGWFVSV